MRIASRVASRVYKIGSRRELLLSIDQAFNAEGIYPPSMKEISPNEYEGEINKGWVLKAIDKTPPQFFLNGKPMPLDKIVSSYKSGYKPGKSPSSAGKYQSGDPQSDGYDFSVTLDKQKSSPTEKFFEVYGTIYGQTVNGQISISIENGVSSGYNYVSLDIGEGASESDNPVLDIVLEACEFELMEAGIVRK